MMIHLAIEVTRESGRNFAASDVAEYLADEVCVRMPRFWVGDDESEYKIKSIAAGEAWVAP